MKIVDSNYVFKSAREIEEYSTKNYVDMNEYIFNKIKDAFNQKKNSVIIFSFYKSHRLYNITINRTGFLKPIKKCLQKFEGIQDYENCMLCLELLNRIKEEITLKA